MPSPTQGQPSGPALKPCHTYVQPLASYTDRASGIRLLPDTPPPGFWPQIWPTPWTPASHLPGLLSMELPDADQASSWEEDRKFVLRGWCLVFNILATLMLLSVLDGRMAYLQGSYTGYLGLWTSCGKHKCASLGQVTVLIHMSTGFMILALILCLVLLPAMGFSFRPVFRRLNKADLIFSSLSFCVVQGSWLSSA
ncbi:uncharacterized protein [Pseudorca crassidens]|uniref:uncharacterized protein isoform X2 n=1 Tax=Pseudorca crassidens TaxID=82174 RepID=UPI00352D0228